MNTASARAEADADGLVPGDQKRARRCPNAAAVLDGFVCQDAWTLRNHVPFLTASHMRLLLLSFLFGALFTQGTAPVRGQALPLRIALFEAPATPPVGTPLTYSMTTRVVDSLRVRGLVLLTGEAPIVLCAVDWIGIANSAYDAWRMTLAEAAGTSPDRVALHALHQHDAPTHDLEAELLAYGHGAEDVGIDPSFAQATLARTAEAIRTALLHPTEVTHLGLGSAKVEKVASNRRVLGEDGNVQYVRWSASKDSVIRAAPEGLIDPYVRAISFWNGDRPLVALTYYATHPQSYYGAGEVSSDFVGIARDARQQESGVFHVHFNGAAGNITAGKYNDGAPENRPVLARRLADGMAAAWAATEKQPLTAAGVGWKVESVYLPLAPHLKGPDLLAGFRASPSYAMARNVAWARRAWSRAPILVSALRLNDARVLHMPGELFVEYQLAAQRMRPDLFVAMAAYGDYGPGYIGTRSAYPRGGYEVGPASRVAADVEDVMTAALRRLLDAPDREADAPSAFTDQKSRYIPGR